MARWRDLIHGGDPYQGFPSERFLRSDEGWGHDSLIFEVLIRELRPQKIIEVGSWVGASAMRMADLLVQHEIDGEIVCVDTWLGTAQNWIDWTRPVGNYGHPLHYFQFLTNIIRAGHCDRVIPFAIDSFNAALFFEAKGMRADLIYIDASHDYGSVCRDINAFWQLVKPGGAIFGDDYDPAWPGVMKAVDEFSFANGIYVDLSYAGKWMARKP